MRRLIVVLVALVAIFGVTVAGSEAKKVPPVQVGMPLAFSGEPVEVTPAQAQAAAKQPGAVTQGSALGSPSCAVDEYGNCLGSGDEAWSADDDGTDGTMGWYDYSAKHCWFATFAVEWAFWPIQGRISNDEFWCSMYYDYLSYRSSHVRLGTSICGKSNAGSQRIGGWIGNYFIDTRSSGTFTCPLKWIWMNFDEWFDNRVNAGGGGAYLGSS